MSLPETGVKLVVENESGFLGALNNATGAVDKFGRNAKGASVGTIALGTAVGNLAAGAVRQVAGLFTQAAGATASFLQGSISMAADLEAQMSGVAAVLGVGNEDLEALNDLVINLGINPNLKVSSLEAAQAIEVLAKNGLNMAQIMGGAAEQSIFLANATGADFATAADIATDVMAIFGYGADEMGGAVNGISAVVQSSKFDINDYALALANGGSVAASVGVSFDDFNTAIAAVSPSFSSGMTAGTAMKNLLLRLVPNTEKAGDEMKMLGLITEDGANQFFDAEGNMRSMAEITGILQQSLSGLSDEQKAASLRTIFGNDAMSAAIALSQVGQDEFEALGLSMASVDAGAAAAVRVDNFSGALDIASGAVEAIRLQIGDAFLPVLTQLAQKFSEFVEVNGPKFVAFFEGAATFISNFFGALMEGEGFLMSFMGALESIGVGSETLVPLRQMLLDIKDFFVSAFNWVVENKDAIIGAIVGIGIALGALAAVSAIAGILAAITNPLTLIIALAGLLGAAWATNWMGIRDTLTEVWEGTVKPALIVLKEWLEINIPIAIEFLKDKWENVLLPALETVWNWINDDLIPLLTTWKEWLDVTIPAAIEILKNTWENVLLPALKTVWSWISDNLIPLFTELIELKLVVMQNKLEILKGVWVNVLLPAIKEVYNWLQDNLVPLLSNFAENYLSGIILGFEGISAAIDILVGWIGTLIDKFNDIKIPDQLTSHSPTPFEMGIRGINSAMREMTTIIPEVKLGLDNLGESANNVFEPKNNVPAEFGASDAATYLNMRWGAMKDLVASAPGFNYAGYSYTPPASSQQQMANNNNSKNTTNNVTLNNDFTGTPVINDKNVLMDALAGL